MNPGKVLEQFNIKSDGTVYIKPWQIYSRWDYIYPTLNKKKKEKHASKIVFLPIGPQKLHGCV